VGWWYGRSEATNEEVAAVAEAALVTEFADLLPDGLSTVVAAGGVGLSGGQRQRVGIARRPAGRGVSHPPRGCCSTNRPSGLTCTPKNLLSKPSPGSWTVVP